MKNLKNLRLRILLPKPSTQLLLSLAPLLTPPLLLQQKETKRQHRGGLEQTEAVSLPQSRC